MAETSARTPDKIDSLMETASRALVQCRYHDCERLCVEALERAFVAADYERMARILLPLEEARRQKRCMAFDTRHVSIVDGTIPTGRNLKPGCYLVAPPRVGIDGRLLREAANKKKVPVIIVVREPESRDGKWPVVSIGPVTIRTKVDPPRPAADQHNGQLPSSRRARGRPAPKAAKGTRPGLLTPEPPPPEWFLYANESLGDKAIAGLDPAASPVARVEALFKCLQAHPDHEKLHQHLADACHEAAKLPNKIARSRAIRSLSLDDD